MRALEHIVIAGMLFVGGAAGSVAAADSPVAVNIPSQGLGDALNALAAQTGLQLIFNVEEVMPTEVTAPAVRGTLTPEAALRALLVNTRLQYKFIDSRTVALSVQNEKEAAAEASPARAMQLAHVDTPSGSTASQTSVQTTEDKQTAAAPADNSQEQKLEEILVTAQKREQSVHDVPMAIEVRTGEFIEQTGFVDFEDYARTISNIAFTPSGGRNNISISLRGISPLTGSPTVALYLDETPISTTSVVGSIDPRLFDISRIEVLKGPQGHLYGASAMGGVIKIVTNQPKLNEWETRIDATLSSTHYGELNVLSNMAVNLPLVEDRAALRFVVTHGRESGYVDRVSPFAGTADRGADPIDIILSQKNSYEDINSLETLAIRASMLVKATDWLQVTPAVYYQRKEYAGLQGVSPDASGGIDGPPRASLYQDNFVESVLKNYALTAVADLAFGSVTSNTSYFDFEPRYGLDITRFASALTGAPPTALDTLYFPPYLWHEHYKQLVQEIRFVSDWEFPLGLTAGMYYRNIDNDGQAQLIPPGAGAHFGLPTDVIVHASGVGETTQKALFGNLTYGFRGLEFQAGARYFDFDINSQNEAFGIFVVPGAFTTDTRESDVIFSSSISYEVTGDHKIYARAAQGFRQGSAGQPPPAVLCGAVGADNNVDSDSVWNYELGAKTRWANGRLGVNAAAFWIDYSDVQQLVRLSCGFTVADNAGSATSKGAEVEVSAELLNGLVLTGSAGYVESTLEKSVPTVGGDAGESLVGVPSWTANASLAYTRGTGIAALDANFGADWSYVGEKTLNFGGVGTRPSRYTDSNSLLSLRAGVSHDNGWQASVFVNNVLDKRADMGINDFGVPLVLINEPRTIGINFKKDF